MSELRRGKRMPRTRLIVSVLGLLAVIGVCAGVVFFVRGNQAPAARNADLINPRRTSITATVNATGQISPAQTSNLSFVAAGRVSEIMAKVGDTVQQGATLAQLDTRELQLRLTQADAALAQSQANLDKLRAGATPAEIEASEAQVRQAQAQQRQVAGGVTPADIAAAQAQLTQAQAQLDRLNAGPKDTDVRTAQAQLDQAQAQFASQRDQLSATKTNAQLQLEQSTEALTQAQSRYATAKANWDIVQETGADPVTPRVPDASNPGKTKANRLNDAQRQQYYDAFVQSEAALRSSEASVQQASVSADNARQAEANGVTAAEQQITTAQANLERVQAGSDADALAAAQAQVQSARANLAKLQGDQRSGSLAAAQAGVEAAQANLERIQAGPVESDLAVGQAQIQSAQAARELAQLSLDQATLTAPFTGVIAEMNLKVGELPPAIPVVLADLSSYYVDVAVDEIDVSRVSATQAVSLTLDALPGVTLAGSVETVAELSTAQSAVTSYQVRIRVPATDERVRAGMSTNADIVVAQQENVLVVPRRAVRSVSGRLLADVTTDPAMCGVARDQRPANIALQERQVTTGLSNEQVIEITSGLTEQDCVNVEGFDTRSSVLFGGPPPRQ